MINVKYHTLYDISEDQNVVRLAVENSVSAEQHVVFLRGEDINPRGIAALFREMADKLDPLTPPEPVHRPPTT